MNQRTLEYFVKVVEAGSFSQAAILLGIAQAAISRHVKDLETELRINLLYRNGRGVILTEAGERLYARATAILEQIEQARSEVLHLSGAGITSAVVGLPPSVARTLSVPLTDALRRAYPDARLRLIEAFNGYLLEWLCAARLDAAILYAGEAAQRLNAEPLFSEPLHLIGASGRAAIALETPALRLAELPMILPSRPHGLRHQLEMWAARNGIELSVRAECDSFCSLIELVRKSDLYTILPAAALREEIAHGFLTSSLIIEPTIDRALVLALPPNRPVSASVTELTRLVKVVTRLTYPAQLPPVHAETAGASSSGN